MRLCGFRRFCVPQPPMPPHRLGRPPFFILHDPPTNVKVCPLSPFHGPNLPFHLKLANSTHMLSLPRVMPLFLKWIITSVIFGKPQLPPHIGFPRVLEVRWLFFKAGDLWWVTSTHYFYDVSQYITLHWFCWRIVLGLCAPLYMFSHSKRREVYMGFHNPFFAITKHALAFFSQRIFPVTRHIFRIIYLITPPPILMAQARFCLILPRVLTKTVGAVNHFIFVSPVRSWWRGNRH